MSQRNPVNSTVPDAVLTPSQGPYASPTPRYVFAETLEAQEAQLAKNPLMLRFARYREKAVADPYRPIYHFVSPDGCSNDPNGLCFWQGRWHLFYQAFPEDELPDPKEDKGKRRAHWGHAVSEDLIHWRDLPYALYPGIEKQCYSAGALVEDDRVVVLYPGIGIGEPVSDTPDLLWAQMVATSSDPLLLNWEQRGPLNTQSGDADIWKEGSTYFGLIRTVDKYYADSSAKIFTNEYHNLKFGVGVWPSWALYTSQDLDTWTLHGDFVFEKSPLTGRYNDGSCPNFKPIGDKHILIFFSHLNGGQYLLGDYDRTTNKFRPYDHGRFNHGNIFPGGVWAPSAASTGKGDVINILSISSGVQGDSWNENQLMSLPQRLALGADKRLRIEPVETVTSLRAEHRRVDETTIPTDRELILEEIRGNTMELNVEIDPMRAHWVRLNVLRSPGGEEETAIILYNINRPLSVGDKIILDGSRSTIGDHGSLRPPEQTDVHRGGENLKLRIFIDRSVVEVFVNGKQYLAMRVYPSRKDSLGVSLRAHGQQAVLKRLDAWQMKPIWPV